MKSSLAAAAVALALSSAHAALAADPSTAAITGRWDAALIDNGPAVPFRLDIAGSGGKLEGTFYDGFHPYDATTSITFKDGKLVLKAEHYLTTITAGLKNGELVICLAINQLRSSDVALIADACGFDAIFIDGFLVHGARNLALAVSRTSSLFDKFVVDGIVNGVGSILNGFSALFRRVQTGYVSNYALVMAVGMFALVCLYLVLQRG